MTRKKVKLAYIVNNASRRATFNKRKKGLLKKVKEISTLCGINACAVVYGPNDLIPEVWPSNTGVQQVIAEFRALPMEEQQKKMMDMEETWRQRNAKVSTLMKRQYKQNRDLEMTEIVFQCFRGNMGNFNMNPLDLNDLGYIIDRYIQNVDHRMEFLHNSGMEIGESSSAVPVVDAEGVGTIAAVTPTTAHENNITEDLNLQQ